MKQYHDQLQYILENGHQKEDRTGVGTVSTFGLQARYDLSKGFPIVTTKKVPFKLIISELLWFLKGDTNLKYLLEHNNHIWDEWGFKHYVESNDYDGPDMTNFGKRALEDPNFAETYKLEMKKYRECILNDDNFAKQYGDLGNIYGKQWRDFNGIDQIKQIIDQIKHNPESRRHIVTAWNPTQIDTMALPPCHTLFQFYVQDNKLSCQLYQRSADMFLGVPFNIASYSLLIHLIANECGLDVGEFVHTIGDAHIYTNHVDQVKELLSRTPLPLPTLHLNENRSIFEWDVDDIELINYQHHATIKAPIAV